MISVKEAAKIASVGGLAWKTSVRLEELEAGDLNGNKVWFITLSIPAPDAEFLDLTRQHKVFAVHAQSGEVMSMKIREFSGVHD